MTKWNPVLATRFLRPSYAKPFRKLVIARSVSDEAIQYDDEELDCFASLAMTTAIKGGETPTSA